MLVNISAEISAAKRWLKAGGQRTDLFSEDVWMIAKRELETEKKIRTSNLMFMAATIISAISIISLIVTLSGCAPSVNSGVKTINRGLVEVDQALERDTRSAGEKMIVQIQICKAQELKTEEERKQCLGKWAEPVPVEEYKKIRDAYDRIYFDAKEIEARNERVNRWQE